MATSIEHMTVFELSRWFALMDCVNIISEECTDRRINFEKEIDLKSLHIRKYINSTSDIFANQHEREQSRISRKRLRLLMQ